MLICHPIPWNWNWVLDWVSVHPACYSLLILRRYPCIGIGYWIGPELVCYVFFDTPCMFTLELELCIGLAHSLDWPVC